MERLLRCKQGKGKQEVGSVIAFLEEYVLTHFGLEEKYMLQYSYPGYAGHKKLHVEFISSLNNLKKQIETEGVGVHIVIATNQLVVRWFVDHIRHVDVMLGQFLKNRPR